MKKEIPSLLSSMLLLLMINCSKNEKTETPDSAVEDRPNVPIVVPNPPLSGNNDANSGNNKPEPGDPDDTGTPTDSGQSTGGLLPLPASGVPKGWNSWDEFNSIDPAARSQSILDGTDPKRELFDENPLCSVFVLASYLNDKAQPTYVLRTSFSHHKQTHGYLLVSVDKEKPHVSGTGASGQDQIYLEFKSPGDLFSAQFMNLKWFHINHFDTDVCKNLRVRQIP